MATPTSTPPPKKMRLQSPVGDDASRSTTNGASSSKQPLVGAGVPDASKQKKGADKKNKAKEKARQVMLAKTGEEPIAYDIIEVLGQDKVDEITGAGDEWADRYERGTTLEGKIVRLSATGSGIFVNADKDWVLSVPHALPGETVRVRVDRNERMYSKCDLLEVVQKSSERRDDLIGCKYFGECPGCQYQMLPYEKQLEIKRDVVVRAFAHFSGLDAALIPAALPTLPSPKEYSYRTKLTPHFELPRSLMDFRRKHEPEKAKFRKRRGKQQNHTAPDLDPEELEHLSRQWGDEVTIGFDALKGGGKSILDIEECPIATPSINRALPTERARVKSNINSYPNGATILLRDSLTVESFGKGGGEEKQGSADSSASESHQPPMENPDTEVITSYRTVVREQVGTTKFETPSGSFFQNNRAILPSLIEYVREAILDARRGLPEEDNFLVDTYCGSGLFALMLAPLFKRTAGVEIDSGSIEFAKRNAQLNGMDNVEFLAGNAEEIFGTINFPAERTTVVIDPPRRGCDEAFIKQLVALSPSLVVYVSCNVHTQARDVGSFLGKAPEYEIASIRGADLFPQTYHVEGVCILRKKRVPAAPAL
ncbi:unnamed protein product [Parajaminaea phylloscopi]